MHIKQIIIEGFKSYGKRTVIGPLDPGHNVVVGKNGSGKSNFFAAIQFVLSDEYNRLRETQRQELMFEGAGPRVISACVEIVFDNTDRRLPIEKNEVLLRRVIGLKKDQYFLNKKMIEKTDVLNLLETGGFSRSNPYYIVRQGKINEMTMAPEKRLILLLEIAGINVYEEKKTESYSILKDAKSKLEKIANLLSVIDERLETLKEEVKELQEYLKLDKQRRALEHIIYHQTLSINKDKLHQLEEKGEELFRSQKEVNKIINEIQGRIKTKNKQYKEAQKKLKNAKEETTILSEEQEQLVTMKNKLQFSINDLSEEITKNNHNQEKIIKDLKNLEIQIEKHEETLNSILPEYEQIVYREEEITKNLNLNEQKLKELYNKQGRSLQFQNKEDRDKWIEEELKKINHIIEKTEKREVDRKGSLTKYEESRNLLSKEIQDCKKQLDDQKSSIDRFNKEYHDLDKEEQDLISKRKDLYRQDQRLQDEFTSLKDELAKADYTLRSMYGRSSFDGNNSVEKVLETFRNHPHMSKEVNKYCGLVIENFDCNSQLYKAVEVTAGNRLFYHIVETNWFGRQILKEMNKQHLPGEVSFMPLDTLDVKIVDSYPSSGDTIPLIQKLTVYQDKCKKVMSYIFGRTLVCRDMEIAKDMARKHRLECVTLEGDQASSKGWLKGGYFSNSKSPLNTQNERAKIVQQIAECENQLSNLKAEIEQKEELITVCIGNRQRKEILRNRARDNYDKLKNDMNKLENDLKEINKNIVSEKKSLQHNETNKEIMYITKISLENEHLQEFTGHLSASDEQEINKLKGIITEYKQELKGILNDKIQVEKEKNKIESTLNDNLRRKRDELSQQLKEVSTDDKQLLLTESEAQLMIIEEKIIQNQINFDEQKNKLQTFIEEEEKILQVLKEEKPHEKRAFEEMEIITKGLERIATSENIVKKNLENCKNKIFDLGAVPNKELRAKFEDMSNKELFKTLNEIKTQLKNYDHVNQKALDQLNTSIEQRKTLRKRKDELDKGYNKIQQLLEILQQRKREAIDFTFKQVSKYFSEIFEKLVPVGHAQLVMKTGNTQSMDSDSISDSLIDSDYVGIDITVSFTGESGEMRNMNQLSGGQKSLVALTLIFAIQKCDPAPFYLFDEIDSALDDEHRQAVAKMIHELSTEAQFITTTFSPELLQNANKFYGVVVKDNLSFIECVTRESAVNFIEYD